jgi:RNase P/RNase MRP subunit p29
MKDDFYIGYEALMPASLAGRIRVTAVAVIVLALVVSGVLVFAQGRFATATFEYGQTRTFEGRLVEYPYPALLVAEPTGASRFYWLVGAGKHGAFALVTGRDGQMVRVSGSLIERDQDRMIEVPSREAIIALDSQMLPLAPLRSLGRVVVRGEIVDSKCHLGVMKPGEGATHRDCAVRCLLGRVTPMFAPSRHDARVGRLALVDADGQPITESLETIVGRPVEIRGELLVRGPQRFLATKRSAMLTISGRE